MPELWPMGVPSLALAGSMKGKPFRSPHATDMEDGNRVYRRSSTKNIATYSFSLIMSNTAFGIFKAWVRDDLVDGTVPFRAFVYDGAAASEKACSFTQPYDDDPTDGSQHVVSMTLDIEDY